MTNKITFTSNRMTTIKVIDDYCKTKGLSRSKVISSLLNITTPVLKQVINHYKDIESIESLLVKICLDTGHIKELDHSTLTIEEHFMSIWKNNIKHEREFINNEVYRHKPSSPKMGNTERESIREMLLSLTEKLNAKKAIFIYTDRRVNNKYLLAGGISNTLIIKETTYDDYFFDFHQLTILPIFDLILLGTEKALMRNNLTAKTPCICWIPIYHTNDKAIMLPIIRKDDAPNSSLTGSNAIIINPFSKGQ